MILFSDCSVFKVKLLVWNKIEIKDCDNFSGGCADYMKWDEHLMLVLD